MKGEEQAKDHYEHAGFEILEQNFRSGRSEIDLIALQDENLLVFIEVKFRGRKDFGEAETFVSRAQEARIKQAAEDYIFSINWKKDIRFDIVAIDQHGSMEIFEDAF